MDEKQAQTLIKETFESPFDKNRFVGFVKNLLNDVEEATFIYKGNYIPDAYEQYIHTLERIGKYTNGEHKIDILIAKLRKETSIERARTMQRNFVAWYLNGSRGGELKDAALVAFVAPNEEDWRFSLVKMDYRFEEGKKGRMRVKEEFTPARRWSFLVGVNENSHTAQSQLVDLVADDERNPAIAQLEEAFNIEKVTKEFFEKYRGLFEKLSKDLKENKSFQIIAGKENIDIDNFAKKLLGQIVFLYFLQKKGWLGVPQDKTWGQGDKFFLRTLFNKAREDKKDFYDSYLEPLFYDTLNNPRRDEVEPAYSRYFGCKVPFLNGGLFEPDYDWKNIIVYLGNEIFKEIIETFDLYNFTVKEDEPLEKEVAVDPEMLGKVFENLLPENMRKGQGAYYTPREIVHYMCQESLINYLSAEIKIDAERIRKLVTFKNEGVVNGNSPHKKALGFSEEEAESLDRALANIKICDPACGSGAFLVGMLNEIVSARRILEPRLEYKLKKETIQNCIYGVDIDPGAVDIAKLRLWLSLVVDFELKDIEPLPNLDYKIMCGNSLLEELIIGDESIKLFDERIFNLKEPINNQPKNARKEELRKQLQAKQRELFGLHLNHKLSLEKKKELEEDISAINKELKPKVKKGRADSYYYEFFAERADGYFKQLRDLHQQYFTEYDPLKKKEKRRQIEDIELEFIKSSIKEKVDEIDGRIRNLNMQNPDDRKKQTGLMKKKLDYMAIPEQIHELKVRPYFLWKLNFFEVFQEKGGFDVVIANPPYGLIFKNNLKKEYEEKYHTFIRNNDIYVAFIERGINLIRNNGIIIYITPNTYQNGDYFIKLRHYMISCLNILEILDFKNIPVFDDPTVFVSIFTAQKNNFGSSSISLGIVISYKERIERMLSVIKIDREDKSVFFKPQNQIIQKFIKDSSIEAFDRLFYIKDVGFNYWTIGKGKKRDGNSIGDRIFYGGKKLSKLDVPFLKGRNIDRFFIQKADNYLRHNCKDFLDPKVDVFRYSKDLLEISPKIIYRQTSSDIRAAIDYDKNYLDKTVHLIILRNTNLTINLKYVLCLLNSKLFQYLYSYISQESSDRVFAQVKTTYMKKLPFKKISEDEQRPFVEVVDKILFITKSEDYLTNSSKQAKVKEYERQIDQMVYDLYDLTKKEIEIVNGSLNGSSSKFEH